MKNIIIALVLVLSSITLKGQVLELSQTDSTFHVSEIISQNGNVSIIKVTSFESEAKRDTFLTLLNQQFEEILSYEEEIKAAREKEHEKQKKLLADKVARIKKVKDDKKDKKDKKGNPKNKPKGKKKN